MEYAGLLIVIAFLYLQWDKARKEKETCKKYICTAEFKKTLALGIYQRFCKENEERKYSSQYLKHTPFDFEHFIADVLKHKYGEGVFVTKGSGDFGVDSVHENGTNRLPSFTPTWSALVERRPASYWHAKILHELDLNSGEVIEFAKLNAGVMQPS
jgi:restriction system protein